MDFSLSEEQQLLKDSVARFVRENYDLEARRKLIASEPGYSEEHWTQMADLGWLGVALPEAYGGIDGGAVETMVIMEEFGRGLVVEPYFPSVVLGANLVMLAGSEAQKTELLPDLAAGRLRLAFACNERQGRFDLFDVATTAVADGDGWVLNGHKGVVQGAASADRIIVSARTSGDQRGRDGITLFMVPADAAGLSRRDYATNDGLRASEVTFEGVRLDTDAVLGETGGGWPAIEQTAERATVALCAEAVGCMEMMKEDTNEYLKTRKQFGQALGRFQVMQHRMVDILIRCEEARSLTYVATALVDSDDARERSRTVSAAKAGIGERARFVGQNAVQMHGGMGVTDELRVGHYFKRISLIDLTFGDVDHHMREYAVYG